MGNYQVQQTLKMCKILTINGSISYQISSLLTNMTLLLEKDKRRSHCKSTLASLHFSKVLLKSYFYKRMM